MTNAERLRKKARECRRLAEEADKATATNLIMLAQDYETEAGRLEGEQANPTPRPE
jgi:hypothetical protein